MEYVPLAFVFASALKPHSNVEQKAKFEQKVKLIDKDWNRLNNDLYGFKHLLTALLLPEDPEAMSLQSRDVVHRKQQHQLILFVYLSQINV